MDPVTWRSAHSLFLHKENLASVCEPCCARLPKLCLRSPLARDSSYCLCMNPLARGSSDTLTSWECRSPISMVGLCQSDRDGPPPRERTKVRNRDSRRPEQMGLLK